MSLFLGVYKALYDYEAQNDEELSLSENDLLYLLEKSDIDDWWKVKRRVVGSDAEEPEGLVPSTYIEPAQLVGSAVALYDYDKQTEEELSFKEGERFDVYDLSDPDWILVGLLLAQPGSDQLQFGFVPANYLDMASAPATTASPAYGSSVNLAAFLPPPQRIDQTPVSLLTPATEELAPQLPSKDVYTGYTPQPSTVAAPVLTRDDDYEEDAPPMPSRPRSSQMYDDDGADDYSEGAPATQRDEDFVKDDFFTWPVQEIDDKGKKSKNTLGVGNSSIYLSPEESLSNARKWKVENLLNFSNEKKHVFLEFEKPYANIELHAGSKDAAVAIISILGDIKGAVSMKGLNEVKEASTPSKHGFPSGKIIFDFEALTEDELSVREDDIVFIINDKKSKDWWMVENADTGERGVIPSNYVRLTKTVRRSSSTNLLSKMSQRMANPKKKKRHEREKEKLRADHAKREKSLDHEQQERRRARRERARTQDERDRIRKQDERERQRLERKLASLASNSASKEDKSRPNPHRVRTWIDRSGSFKVEAEFLGCVDGKIHLHKTNGVKIAVAALKLSVEDIEYVERVTGMSLENYKPKSKSSQAEEQPPPQPMRPQQTGVVDVDRPPSAKLAKDPDYDWFEFFLNCGVDVNNCQRYQYNFNREQMDEKILEDITPSLLRTLGLREGDILRVMKFLDSKFDRKKETTGEAPKGGIFQSSNGNLSTDRLASADRVDSTKLAPTANGVNNNTQFDDDAWAVKPALQTVLSNGQEVPSRPASVPTQNLNGSISDLINLKPIDSSSRPPAVALVKPTAPVLEPLKTGGGLASDNQVYTALNPQMTSGTLGAQITGGLLAAQPTGFVPINFIPTQMTGGFITAQPTGLLPLQATGFIPLQKTGGFLPQPTGGLMPIQKTGGGLVPLQKTGGFLPQTTGGLMPLQKTGNGFASLPNVTMPTGGMPMTSFGQNVSPMPMQKTGGFVPQTSFGQMLVQKTGGGIPVTNFNTGAPQQNFGLMPQQTSSFAPLQPTSTFNAPLLQQPTGFPQTSFGLQPTGGFPQTSFGAPQPTGGFPQTSFGNMQPTGGFPQTSFGNMQPTGGLNNGFNNGMNQQPAMNMNNLSNMFQNTSISSPPPQQPFTSFGQQPQFGGFPAMDQPLQSQPTGFGFGNAGGLQPQKTGRANLANATADNPFGF